LNKGFTLVAVIALSSVFVASIADAGTAQKKKSSGGGYSGPETGLLGVKLFDSGLRVISLYGNPDSITTVGGGTSNAGGGGGQSGPPGGFGGPPSSAGAGGGGGGKSPGAESLIPGGGFGIPLPDMQKGSGGFSGGAGDSAPAPGQGQGQGRGGPPSAAGAPGGSGGGGQGSGGAGGGGATESAVFTRWSYIRNGSKLAFVIDKFNRVIQIEAIGLQNQRIKTRRGVGFGSSFSQVMKSYANSTTDPDGYDINGNNFTIRFLTRNRVAFRLTQLSTKKSHVVTGIVVAAGKQ
jgi:hypothetical protein